MDQKSKKMQLWMPKAKFRKRSAAEAVPGEALELDFARTGEWSQHAVSRLPEAGGGGSECAMRREHRRPLTL